MNVWQALTMAIVVAMAIVTIYVYFTFREASGGQNRRSRATATPFAWNERIAGIANDLRGCKSATEFTTLSPAELRDVFTSRSSGLSTLEVWLRQNRTALSRKSNTRIAKHLTKAREIERALASGLEKLNACNESALRDLDTHNRKAVELLLKSHAAEMRAVSAILSERFNKSD